MSSHSVVRRLTAAALLLALAAAPALAAPGSTRADRPHSPRVPVTTGVPMLDRLLDRLVFPAAGPLPEARGMQEKSGSGSPSGLTGLLELLGLSDDRGVLIDPNG